MGPIQPLIEGTSLACLRKALAVELAGTIEALRLGDAAEAAARLTSWMRDTAAALDPETWAAASEREHERWQESHTITPLSRRWREPPALAVPAAALCELLETITAAAGARGWWSELAGESLNLTDEPGAIDQARGLLRAAAEEGTIAADEVRFWRQVAGVGAVRALGAAAAAQRHAEAITVLEREIAHLQRGVAQAQEAALAARRARALDSARLLGGTRAGRWVVWAMAEIGASRVDSVNPDVHPRELVLEVPDGDMPRDVDVTLRLVGDASRVGGRDSRDAELLQRLGVRFGGDTLVRHGDVPVGEVLAVADALGIKVRRG